MGSRIGRRLVTFVGRILGALLSLQVWRGGERVEVEVVGTWGEVLKWGAPMCKGQREASWHFTRPLLQSLDGVTFMPLPCASKRHLLVVVVALVLV